MKQIYHRILPLCMMFLVILGIFAGCGENQPSQQELKEQGIAAMTEGDYETALRVFDEALALSGGRVGTQEVDICYYKAAALYQSGDFEGAEDVYRALMEYDKDSMEPYFLLASIYADQKDIEQARKYYGEAIARDEEDYDLYIAIYENLNALGYTSEATEYLNLALEIDGDKAENSMQRGRIYLIMGQYDAAEKALNKAVTKDLQEARVYLSKVYMAQGKLDEAAEVLKVYAQSDQVTSEGFALLGNVAMDQGNYEDALGYFEKGLACKKVTNDQELKKGVIAALEKSGQFEEAKKKVAEYLEKYPGDEKIQEEQNFLNTR